jgi:hypothetical protein
MNQQTPALKDSPKQAKKFYIRPGTKNKHNMLLMEKVDALAVMVGNFAASQKIMAVTLDGAMTALVATQEQLKELQRANLVKMMQCNRSLRIDGHETNRTPLGIAVPDHLDVHAVPFLEDTIQLENVNSKNVEIPAPDSSNLSARVMLLEGEKDAFGR